MHRGKPDTTRKFGQRSHDGDRHLGHFDLLNLRLNSPPKKIGAKSSQGTGSGDYQDQSQFLGYIVPLIITNKGLKGRHKPVFHKFNPKKNQSLASKITRNTEGTQTRAEPSTPVNDFLLPPSKRNSRHFEGSCQLSSSGDGGNFPFKVTPSGNLKVNSQQVVYESKKLSVLVANPEGTQIRIYEDPSKKQVMDSRHLEPSRATNSAIESLIRQGVIPGKPGEMTAGIGSLFGNTPARSTICPEEYLSKATSEILDPELNLGRLGYSRDAEIDWNRVVLPEKKDLYLELSRRICAKKSPDCKIQIGTEEFSCHLIVLQCYSDLFDSYVAIKKVEIPSDKCTARSFGIIYDWMTSEQQSYKYLQRETVLDVFSSAKYLKIKDLVEQCWAFIDNFEVFNEDTAFLLYVDAKAKGVEEVCELMIPRIQDFFLILVSSQDWLELGVEDVKLMLRSNYIRVNCEMEVFMAGVRWLKHHRDQRDKYKLEVLRCIRFGNIAPWQLVDIKRNPENPEFMDLAADPGVCKLIDDGLAFVIIKYWYGQDNEDFQHWNAVLGLTEPLSRNWTGLDKTYFTYREFLIYLDQYRRVKLIEKSKLGQGGFDDKILVLPPTSTITTQEPPPPQQTQHLSVEDFVKKKVIPQDTSPRPVPMPRPKSPPVVTIKKPQKVNEPAERDDENKSVKKMFSNSQNSLALSRLNRLSKSFICPQNKKLLLETSLFFPEREAILVFGGANPYKPQETQSVSADGIYRYIPDDNRWEKAGHMPEPRCHHGIAFLKGRIYIVGGTDPRPRDDQLHGSKARVVDTVWSFDPATRCWYSETSLGTRRRNFGLVVMNQILYAIGGSSDKAASLKTVEKFDPRHSTWSWCANMNVARAGLACTKYRNYIWAAGGTTDLKRFCILDVVESYDTKSNQWTRIKGLPLPRCFSSTFVINDTLYLIGGLGNKFKEFSSLVSLSNVDCWDPPSLNWKNVLKLTIPRHGQAVAYCGTQIFIIGGVTSIYTRCLTNVECFCAKRGTLIQGISDLPVSLSGHAAITLPPAKLISDE